MLTALQYLELPMEFSSLADCKFPYLKRLNLFLQSGGSRSIDPFFVRFLNDHPTIEDLSWLPLGPVYLSPHTLPALRRLRTNVQVVGMLDCDALEALDIYQLDPATLVQLRNVQGGNVRQVKLHAFGELGALYELAELFPDLTWLSMPSRYGHFKLVRAFLLIASTAADLFLACRRTGSTCSRASRSSRCSAGRASGRPSRSTCNACTASSCSSCSFARTCASSTTAGTTRQGSIGTGSRLSARGPRGRM
jgi:hypothetical protein